MKLKPYYEIRLRYQSFDQQSLKRLIENLPPFLKKNFFSSIRLPIQKGRVTLLRSPHVNKKSRDQLEIRFFNGLVIFRTYLLNLNFLEKLVKFSIPQMSVKFTIFFVQPRSKCVH